MEWPSEWAEAADISRSAASGKLYWCTGAVADNWNLNMVTINTTNMGLWQRKWFSSIHFWVQQQLLEGGTDLERINETTENMESYPELHFHEWKHSLNVSSFLKCKKCSTYAKGLEHEQEVEVNCFLFRGGYSFVSYSGSQQPIFFILQAWMLIVPCLMGQFNGPILKKNPNYYIKVHPSHKLKAYSQDSGCI